MKRKQMAVLLATVALCVVGIAVVIGGDATYTTKTYTTDGGDKFVVANGGVLDVEAGGAFKIAGTQVTVSAAQLNAVGNLATSTSASWTINSASTSGVKLKLDTTGATGNYTYTIAAPVSTTSGTNTLPTTYAKYFAITDNADGTLSATDSTGTINDTFAIDSDASKPRLTLSSDAAGTGNYTLTVKPAATLTGNGTVRIPDAPANDTFVLVGAIQTLTSKTLTAPGITNPNISGTVTITTPTVSGTWANLGVVTTADINGGSIDGVTIGAASAGAATFTTVTATGTATLDNAEIGGAYSGGSGATITNAGIGQFSGALTTDSTLTAADIACGDSSLGIAGKAGAAGGAGGAIVITAGAGDTNGNGGASSLVGGAGAGNGTGGGVTITGGASAGSGGTAGGVTINAGAPTGGIGAAISIGATNAASIGIGKSGITTTVTGDLAIAAGDNLTFATGDGYLQINGATSGALKIVPTASTAQTVTLTTAAQTGGAGSVAIPNLAAGTETLVCLALDQTLTTKTIDGDDNTIKDLSPTVAKVAVEGNETPTAAVPAIPFVLSYQTAATAETGATIYTVPTGKKLRVIRVTGYKVGNPAGAAGTLTILNATNAITDAISINLGDTTVFSAGTIDDAYRDIAAAGTLKVTTAGGGASLDAVVNIECVWVAP